jgi:hypothetical protein
VLNISIDVPVSVSAGKIRYNPQVIGFSGFLTLGLQFHELEALEETGVCDSLKIIIDGGWMDVKVCKYVCAEAYGKDGITTSRPLQAIN